MPLSSDPSATVPVFLAVDKDKPKESRPTFSARYLTRREAAQVRRLMDEAEKEGIYDRAHHMLDAAAAVGIVGWRHMVGRDGNLIPFRTEEVDGQKVIPHLDEFLTAREKWELILKMVSETRASEADLGNSGSPAPSGQA